MCYGDPKIYAFRYLSCERCALFNPERKVPTQDMDRPFTQPGFEKNYPDLIEGEWIVDDEWSDMELR